MIRDSHDNEYEDRLSSALLLRAEMTDVSEVLAASIMRTISITKKTAIFIGCGYSGHKKVIEKISPSQISFAPLSNPPTATAELS